MFFFLYFILVYLYRRYIYLRRILRFLVVFFLGILIFYGILERLYSEEDNYFRSVWVFVVVRLFGLVLSK